MSADNKEFPIPFDESRRAARAEQEEKSTLGRLGRYLGSRAIDRPTIGDGRRNRDRRGRGGFDLPTGGKPGTRTPTGSRRDIDGDGWADEGTTKPVWVGIGGDNDKPKSSGNKIYSNRGTEYPDTGNRLSSGKKYQEIVDSQPPVDEKIKEIISKFLDDLDSDEFKTEDTYIIDGNAPRPPRPPGMPEPLPLKLLQEDDDRSSKKQKLLNLLADAFRGEMELDRDIILTTADGKKLNIGNRVLIEVHPGRTPSKYSPVFKIDKITDKDVAEQDEMQVFDKLLDEGDLLAEVSLQLRITPLPQYKDDVLSALDDSDKQRFASSEYDMPALATAYRGLLHITNDDKDIKVMSHDSFYINKNAQGQGLGSAFNARNEQIYNELGVSSIITYGSSDVSSIGAVHWPKNGFSWGGETDKQKFIGIIDEAIKSSPELFSDEDRKRISSLYVKNEGTGLFETEATAEELVDFPGAYKVFSNAKSQFFYTRPLKQLVGASTGRLSSGSTKRSSRGVHVSELYDGDYDTWEEGALLTPESLYRLISRVFEKNDIDASLPKYDGALEKITEYKDFGSVINDSLRLGYTFDDPRSPNLDEYASTQRLLMDNRITAGITLYRSIGNTPEIASLKEGDTFGDRGFQSFTVMAPGQYSGMGDKRPIVLRLLTTKNTRGRYISKRPNDYNLENFDTRKPLDERYFGINEHEVLLPAGATYKLVKKTQTDDGREIWDVKLSGQGKLSSGAKEVALDNIDSDTTLSSGKPPQYPRQPTYGPFLGKADELFQADSWEEFKEKYYDAELVFLDYETTGLVFDDFNEPSGNGAPVQIGAVKVKNGEIVDRFNVYVDPGMKKDEWEGWSRDNLKGPNGELLTDEFFNDKPSIEQAHQMLMDFAGPDALFGAQNAVFDKQVLDTALESMGTDWRPSGWVDTRAIASLALPKWSEDSPDGPHIFDKRKNQNVPSSSLKAITEYLDVDLGDKHHNADADAEVLNEVLLKTIDGAIKNDWSKDVLSKEKRDAIWKEKLDQFDAEVEEFRALKKEYIDKLSSGKWSGPPTVRKINTLLNQEKIKASNVNQDNDGQVSFNLEFEKNESIDAIDNFLRKLESWAESRQLEVEVLNSFPEDTDFSDTNDMSQSGFNDWVKEKRNGYEVRVYDRLASGGERPTIAMKPTQGREPVQPGRRNVKGYGQPDASGKEVRKNSSTWLSGMTPDEISRVVVPTTPEQHFEMWADDIAGDNWRTNRKWRKFLKKYYDELSKDKNNLAPDYSPEAVKATQDLVRGMLESSPQMLWMFQNFGSPMIVAFTREAIDGYENSPDVKERMELLRKQRGVDKTPFVSGLASREFGLVGLTPRALIDRESLTSDEKGVYPLELTPNRVPEPRDAHIDRSLYGTVIHEYGHWLHYRAIWDTETNGKNGKARSYYGSGKMDDPRYLAALDVAEEYANPETDEEAIGIYTEFVDLTGRDATEMFSAHPDKALTATSYGNVNKREAIAEAFVAIMHPNKDMPKIALSKKLREDIYTLAGVDPDDLPWEKTADGRPIIRLSSGAKQRPEREKRRGRMARALRQLIGADQAAEQPEQTPEPYTFEAPKRPEGLVSFSVEPSERLRAALPIPSEDDLTAELEHDVRAMVLDPVIGGLSPLDVTGFGVSMFSSEEDRKASSSAKRMIASNIAETTQIDPREFIESFSQESVAASGMDSLAQSRFFRSAPNFKALKALFDAIDNLPENATEEEKSAAGRFAIDRSTGSLVSVEKHDKLIQKRFWFDEIIDELEKYSYDDLFGDKWDELTKVAFGDEKSVLTPYLGSRLGGDEIKRELVSFGIQLRTMFGDLLSEIRGTNGKTRTNPMTGRPLKDGEGLAIIFSPVGEIDPRTGKPGMALISTTGSISDQFAKDFKLLIRDGKIVPELERTDEQHRAYDRLYVTFGAKDDFLNKIAAAGIVDINETNVDSPETKDLLKNFLINRLRFISGNAEDYKARYEQKSGVSFFDINTPDGIREARLAIVSDIIHTWAISSNNSNPVALAIQHEARKMFGLDDAVGWYGGVRGKRDDILYDSAVPVELRSELGDLAFDDAPELSEKQSEIIRSVVKAIYDATQHYYKSKGITHIGVWRGMKATPKMAVERGEIAERQVAMRPLSSWTTSSTMAQAFSTSLAASKKPGIDALEEAQAVFDANILMKAYVPVEQIFSNPLTGFGCLGEDEVVLLGRLTDTRMITPPANLLLEMPSDGEATEEARQIVQQTLDMATGRDKVTNVAYRKLRNLGFDDFNSADTQNSSSRLSSGARLYPVTEDLPLEGELSVAETTGVSEGNIPKIAFGKRIAAILENKLGITIDDYQRSTIESVLPNLLRVLNKKRLQEVTPHSVFSDTGRKLLDSISISIATDGIPFVSADPIPQIAEQMPKRIDWRKIELPSRGSLLPVLDKAVANSLRFDDENKEWVDVLGNVVAKQVSVNGESVLKYTDDAAKAKFPLLEAIAPKGYVLPSDAIGNGALSRDALPGIYGEAWRKHSEFMMGLAAKAGAALGDDSLFMGTKGQDLGSFLESYIGGIENPLYFNMGLSGKALQALHDLFGHLGTGRAFDRHGEWANDIAMMSMADHPDSPLSDLEKLAVRHLHFQIYAARRLGHSRRDDSGDPGFVNAPAELFGIREGELKGRRVSLVYAGNFREAVDEMEKISINNKLSSGRKKIQDAPKEDIELALAQDIIGRSKSRARRFKSSKSNRLSSGKVIKYNLIEARMKASDMRVTFNRDPERVAAVKATLTKGFMGGFTVEVDKMDDVKEGIAIARNRHGMKVDAVADFDAEGNPSDELVETFLAWMDFHGPKTFANPQPGADKTTIGGWVSDGTVYLDVVDVYPNNEDNLSRAADMGLKEDQIAVTDLNRLWDLLGRGEDPSPAFIDSGGTGGFTLDDESVRKVSAAISELKSNKFNTGSSHLKRIGNTRKFTNGPITAARRVRNTDFATGESRDYWVISGANGLVKVFTHDQYIKVRDRKIQGLFDKMSSPSDVLKSMFESKNLKPSATMSFSGGRNVGRPKISKDHKGRGLAAAMANLYGFANDLNNVGVQMGDKVVAAMA